MVRLQVGMVCQGGARTTVTSLRIIRLRVVNISVAALRLGLVKRATMSYKLGCLFGGNRLGSTHPFAMNRPSIPALFREQVAKLRSRPMIYSKRDRHWRPLTWLQMSERVNAAAAGLCELGLEPGERVAIIGNSSVEWVVSDLACLSAGIVDVAISETASAEDIIWILKDSGSKGAFVGDPDTLAVIEECRDELPELKFIFALRRPRHSSSWVRTLNV